MFYTILAVLLLIVVVLKFWSPFGPRCPQCQTRREDVEYPLCPNCGWIYEVPGEEDEDFAPDDDENERF